MTGRSSTKVTGLFLLGLLLVCLCAGNTRASAEPEPVPAGMIYGDSYADDTENLILLNRLKQIMESQQEVYAQERELAEAQFAIQSMLAAKANDDRQRVVGQQQLAQTSEYSSDEDAEMLPVPSAVVHHGPPHSGKRTSYMALCHFKICNMGRKRQL